MITEETIKQTKFFMGEDGKCYLVRDVRTVKMVSLICTRDGSESDLLLGDDICSQFTPAEASFEPFIQNKVTAQKPVIIKPQKPPYKAIKINGKLTYRKKSQYKGVSPLPPKRSGKIRYRSLYWDGKKGKPVTLDVLDRELEAAAVYQDFVGNKDKAAEYRSMDKRLLDEERHKADLKEQLENNPDRPIDGAARCEVRRKGGKIYVCNRCGLEYKSRGTCAGCGEKDMHEEPATS